MSSKSLAFEASLNAVSFLLNRNDLKSEERALIQRSVADLKQLIYPIDSEVKTDLDKQG